MVAEASLTHSSKAVHGACFVYCAALQTILNYQDDKERIPEALERAERLATSDLVQSPEIAQWLSQSASLLNQYECVDALLQDPALSSQQAANKGKYDATKDPSSISHGFMLSFYFLHQALRYQGKGVDLSDFFHSAMSQTIELGGNASANAAIVGGLIGALVGMHLLPRDGLDRLLGLDDLSRNQMDDDDDNPVENRPSWLSIRRHGIALI